MITYSYQMTRLGYYSLVNARWAIDTVNPCSYEFEMNAFEFACRNGIVFG